MQGEHRDERCHKQRSDPVMLEMVHSVCPRRQAVSAKSSSASLLLEIDHQRQQPHDKRRRQNPAASLCKTVIFVAQEATKRQAQYRGHFESQVCDADHAIILIIARKRIGWSGYFNIRKLKPHGPSVSTDDPCRDDPQTQ
jgi:hypothetical protein